jgi:pimeloyl-ACP methyl ester carboxylesterase
MLSLLPILMLSAARPQEHQPGQIKLEPTVFKSAGGESVEAQGGVLYVPENRRRPGSRLIELSFIRLKSRSSNPGVPTLYLVGGPGGQAISQVRMLFSQYSQLLDAGELILLDQRGTGTSIPNLECATKLDYPLDKPLEQAELLKLTQQACADCAKAWRDKGVDLEGYNTVENAADVEALRSPHYATGRFHATRPVVACSKARGSRLGHVILDGLFIGELGRPPGPHCR